MFRTRLRKHVFVVQLLLIILGAALIILWVTALKNNRWGMSLNSLGSAILAATFLSILQSEFGIDIPSLLEQRLSLNAQISDLGLLSVHRRIGDESIFHRFENAEHIDLMYNTAKNTSYRYLDRIEQAISRRGCKVRLLVSDPNNPAWQHRQLIDGFCPGINIGNEVGDVISRVSLLIERLKETGPPLRAGSIEVRLLPCLPTGSLVIVDNEIARYTPYLLYSHSSAVPSFDASGNKREGLFDVYKKTFEEAWVKSTLAISADFSRPSTTDDFIVLRINEPS